MSIDYDANYGIGYQVCESSELIEGDDYKDNYDSDFIEYVDRNCCDGFESFQTGSHLSGNITGNFLVFKDFDLATFDFNEFKTKIDAEMMRLKLEPVGEFSLVGGLLIW